MSLRQTPLFLSRYKTRVVTIGNLKIGGSHPICIQSMLTSDTRDVPRVLKEITSLAQAKCELIRITVPNQQSLDSMPAIRQGMKERGIAIPLVADIHFNPKLALGSCEFFEKVRINPGNYVDRKRFEIREYTDQQYQEELERIEETFVPLIHNLKKYNCALRIGTNHGSLSDRIMNRYGDTPEGMVESALEFIRIAEKHDYHEIIISMKSSIPLVMLQAYRQLVLQMEKEGMNYPLHLGVTEAGNGIDGRVKSAIGIGTLLNDGIGDTIRVSLTEPAEQEIPAAQSILDNLQNLQNEVGEVQVVPDMPSFTEETTTETIQLDKLKVGGPEAFRFMAISPFVVSGLAFPVFDHIFTTDSLTSPETLVPALVLEESQLQHEREEEVLSLLSQQKTAKLILVKANHPLFPVRRLLQTLNKAQLNWPVGVILPMEKSTERWIGLASEVGSLIADKKIQALVCPTADLQAPIFEFCQTLLQSTRVRLFKADFISCPSCGRTFFDLETTTEAIKAKTKHLKGVKIGIMGCIVNGPGEMADADFGYVGAGEGKIHLYRQQECVARNIPETQAVDQLIALIKEHGQWVEPDV